MAEKKLTAAEVRELPVGATVIVHGHDRHGEAYGLPCTIAQGKRSKVLVSHDYYGMPQKMSIRDYPNKFYTVE